jgi:hypothetical protein
MAWYLVVSTDDERVVVFWTEAAGFLEIERESELALPNSRGSE